MDSKKTKILFSADLHGNTKQYKKLFDYAFQNKIDIIILGGDITPKDSKNRTPEKQKEFLVNELFLLILEFNQKNKERNQSCDIYIILGNDDFISNIGILEKNQKKFGFHYIHNKCIPLNNNLKICGYSFVPLTPFINKGWEKLDTNNLNENEYRKGFLTEGIVLDIDLTNKKAFDLEKRDDTIENDLKKLLLNEKENEFILVSHSPPYKTKLDITSKKDHVGSIALKEAILDKKPLISLHGHIHEAFDISGDFLEKIGETISINCSNDHLGDKVSVVLIDLANLKSIKRIIL